MLSHKPLNKWHEGLLSLFGYMDASMWTILWAIASKADENGHCRITNQQIADSMVRNMRGFEFTLKYMKMLGLVRVARIRVCKQPEAGVCAREVHCRLLELYQGIQYGKIPSGSSYPLGLVPEWHKRGRTVKWQTHKLFRNKFKPIRVKPEYESYPEMSRTEQLKLVPSISYRRKLLREKLDRNFLKRTRWFKTMARNREFL